MAAALLASVTTLVTRIRHRRSTPAAVDMDPSREAMGENWRSLRCGNRIELRSSAPNCTVATCRLDIFAGQVMI